MSGSSLRMPKSAEPSAIAAAVADGSADFGILSELPLIEGLSTVPFRNDELVVVLQTGHPLAQRQSLTFAEIADQPFVGLHAGSALHHVLTRAATETCLLYTSDAADER